MLWDRYSTLLDTTRPAKLDFDVFWNSFTKNFNLIFENFQNSEFSKPFNSNRKYKIQFPIKLRDFDGVRQSLIYSTNQNIMKLVYSR